MRPWHRVHHNPVDLERWETRLPAQGKPGEVGFGPSPSAGLCGLKSQCRKCTILKKLTHRNERSIPPTMQSKPSFLSSSTIEAGLDAPSSRFENRSQVSNCTLNPACRKQEAATYAWNPLSKRCGMLVNGVTHPIVYHDRVRPGRDWENVPPQLWTIDERFEHVPFLWTLPLYPAAIVTDILE